MKRERKRERERERERTGEGGGGDGWNELDGEVVRYLTSFHRVC